MKHARLTTMLFGVLAVGLLTFGCAGSVEARRSRRDHHDSYKVDKLIRDLRYGDTGERKDAAKKLGDYRGPRVVFALSEAVVDDPKDDVRERAVKSLKKIGSPRALPALIHALRYDDEDDIREEAAKALGDIGHPAAIGPLRRAALDDDEDDVREAARKALKKIEKNRPRDGDHRRRRRDRDDDWDD